MAEADDVGNEAWIEHLEATGAFKVLRRFEPCSKYHDAVGDRTAAAIDVETTGTDHACDLIIQLSVVLFTYEKTSGKICTVAEPLTFFEDPGRPLPAEITKLTGISDADVAGKQIDVEAVLAALDPVQLVIAHNARFDRPFVERRLPALAKKAWACSMNDVPWRTLGMSSLGLEYLLIKHASCFHGAHRADNDCRALIHLLATACPNGTLPMGLLLEAARCRTVRIWAQGAPIELKDRLKSRGYRWSNGDDGKRKSWYRDLPENGVEEQQGWLREHIFGGRVARFPTDTFNAWVRYSQRM